MFKKTHIDQQNLKTILKTSLNIHFTVRFEFIENLLGLVKTASINARHILFRARVTSGCLAAND